MENKTTYVNENARGTMVKIQNKTTKKIRVAQIVFFMIEIFLTSCPFFRTFDAKGNIEEATVLDMLLYIGTSGTETATEMAPTVLGLISILFLLIPTIALGFQIFDRFYNLKNIAGIICSGAGVLLILSIGVASISWGSVFAILLYLLTFFMSVMGIFARYLKVENIAEKAPK